MDDETLRRRAVERLVRIELNCFEEERDVAYLLSQGREPDDIAGLIGMTPKRIQMVKRMLDLHDGLGPETPREIIARAVVLHTDHRQLVERLKTIAYTFPEYAPHPYEGATSSTWDDIVDAYYEGWLTREDYDEIKAAAGPAADHLEDPDLVEDADPETLVIVADDSLVQDIRATLDDITAGRPHTPDEALEAPRHRRDPPT